MNTSLEGELLPSPKSARVWIWGSVRRFPKWNDVYGLFVSGDVIQSRSEMTTPPEEEFLPSQLFQALVIPRLVGQERGKGAAGPEVLPLALGKESRPGAPCD